MAKNKNMTIVKIMNITDIISMTSRREKRRSGCLPLLILLLLLALAAWFLINHFDFSGSEAETVTVTEKAAAVPQRRQVRPKRLKLRK